MPAAVPLFWPQVRRRIYRTRGLIRGSCLETTSDEPDILTAVTHGGAVDLRAVPDPDFVRRLMYCLLSHVAKGELLQDGEIGRKSEKGENELVMRRCCKLRKLDLIPD